MELQKHKCSFEDHKNIDAIKYCQECNIYLPYLRKYNGHK